MKIQECINKTVIEIDIDPDSEWSHMGICLFDSEELHIIVNFDEESNSFDGISFFRGKDINRFRVSDVKFSYDEVKKYSDLLPLKNMSSISDAIYFFINNRILITINLLKDISYYYVGQPVSLKNNKMTIRLIDKSGEFTSKKDIILSDITFMSAFTRYLEEIGE